MTGVYFSNNQSFLYTNNSVFIEDNNRYNLYLNSSSCFYNDIDCTSVANQTTPDPGFREAVEKRIRDNPLVVLEIIGLCFLVLAIVFGNVLVVLSVFRYRCFCCGKCQHETNYRATPSHYLMASLAGADLILGIFVLPLSGAREIAKEWYMGENLCSFWTTLDVLSCTASIISLCAIAVDRYIGVSKPLRYAKLVTKKKIRLVILVIWMISFLICLGPPLGWNDQKTGPVGGHYMPRSMHRHHTGADCHVNKQLGYVIFSAIGSFYIPACIVIVVYWLIFKVARKHAEDLRKGQYVANSDVTLRVHQGGYSSDTQSMLSMSSSLNMSSSQDIQIPAASVEVVPHVTRVNGFMTRVRSDVAVVTETASNNVSNSETGVNGTVTCVNGVVRPVGGELSMTPNRHSMTGVNGSNAPNRNRLTSVTDRSQDVSHTRNRLSSISDSVISNNDSVTPVRRRLTPVTNKSVARVKGDLTCVMSPQGNHLMPLAHHFAPKCQIPSSPKLVDHTNQSSDQIKVQQSENLGCQSNAGARNSNAGDKSSKSNRSFRDKYIARSLFAKDAKYRRQLKAAKTLGIVVGTFLVCWSPFFLLLPIEAACPGCNLQTVFNIAMWMGYVNSCLNPLIYACSSRELRKSFERVLYPRRKHKRKSGSDLV